MQALRRGSDGTSASRKGGGPDHAAPSNSGGWAYILYQTGRHSNRPRVTLRRPAWRV